MKRKMKQKVKPLLSLLMTIAIIACAMITNNLSVYATDGTITYNSGPLISYGDYFTTRMTFDGNNTAYCMEPTKYAPENGTLEYNLLGNDSPVRKALYYLPGGYGYDKYVKHQYLSGWSEDNAYVIGHLVVAYIYAGYSSETGAFHGAPQSYIDKALEITNTLAGLPAPPNAFRAFIVPGNTKQTIAGSWYRRPVGYIELRKSTTNASVSDGNGNYSLAGAQYGVYLNSNLVQTLVTDENGYAKSGDLDPDAGRYTVKEIKASKGYALDVKSYDVAVKDEATSSLEVKEIPQNNPLELLLQKLDSETEENKPQGAASLKDAEFTVKFYTEQSDKDPAKDGAKPIRTWIFKTDEEGQIKFTKDYLISRDEFYYQADGKTICLPLGTLTLEETKAPSGYLRNEKVFVQKITGEGTEETVNVYNTPNVPDQVYRGDLEFIKVSDGDLNRLANVPFTITSKTTGESHTLLTDENGYASTSSKWNKHTANTNRGETAQDGIWFGTSLPDDSKGALIYDQYIIEEQRCAANEGMNLLKIDVNIYKDSTTVQLGTLTDDRIEISTTAINQDSNSHLSEAKKKVTIIDTVECDGLKKGMTYRLAGTIMDKDTGEQLLVDGKPITSETSFKAKKSSCKIEVEFVFDATSLAGKTIVVFEELYQEDLKLAAHADIEDENQTIRFPLIGTKAKDLRTDMMLSQSAEDITVIDTVEYKNLIPMKEYQIVGVFMDKDTGESLEINGEKVTSTKTFTPEDSNGSIEVSFKFDGSSLKGKTAVVFETLTYKGKNVAVHADINDTNQTILFPEITTTAKDGDDGDQEVSADEDVIIIDTVKFKNLLTDADYKLVGTLMDKTTGKEIEINGKKVISEATFMAEELDGTVDVTFQFPGTSLAGHDVVVFEKLYLILEDSTELEIASHEDITDKGQTIKLTEIPADTPPVNPPKTGDTASSLIYIGLASTALILVMVITLWSKRKRNK